MKSPARYPSRCCALLLAALLAGTFAAPAFGVVLYSWTGNDLLLPLWNFSDNWSGNSAPSSSDETYLVFNSATGRADHAVSIASFPYTIGAINFAGNISFDLQGSTLTLRPSPSFGFSINMDSQVPQTIENPITLGSSQVFRLSQVGQLNLTGGIDTNGYTLSVAAGNVISNLSVNLSGTGGLAISGNSVLLSGQSTYTGTTRVGDGTGVATLVLGDDASLGRTSVSVYSNGILALNGSGSINAGYSTNTLTVDGTLTMADTSNFVTGPTFIGNGALTGTYRQSGGTFASTAPFFIGYNAGSRGTATVNGGTLNPGQIIVGYNGAGSLTQNGGSVSNAVSQFIVGYSSDGSGTYTLNGGSLSTNHGVVIGGGGSGTFTQTGGTFAASGILYLGYNATGAGTVNLQGGTMTANGVQRVAGSGTFNFNGGTLQAAGGSASFLQGLSAAYVQSGGATGTAVGGALIDTQSYNVTIAQPLLHDAAAGAPAIDGGLTKLGGGTLTLSGANTYTGPTTISAGTLQAGVNGIGGTSSALGANSAVTLANVAGAALDLNGFDTQIGSLSGGGSTGGNVLTGAATLVVGADNTSPAAFAGGLSGPGNLRKIGTGTLTLSGSDTHTGNTTVSAGTLLVNGTQSGTGAFSVSNSGSVLGGTGSIAAAVSVSGGGTLNPGNNVGVGGASSTVGTLSVGALTLSNNVSAIFDVNSATLYDRLLASGGIDFNRGTLTLNVNPNAMFAAGQVLHLFHTDDRLRGTFAGIDNGGFYNFGGSLFQAMYTPTDFNLVVVPEPATWLGGMLLLGMAGVGARRRFSKLGR